VSDPNDEHLAEELERITAREAAGETPPHARLEDEASLRESWLAFGRLLEAANDDFDEAVLAAKLRPAAPANNHHSRRLKPLARWIGIAAIAASLLGAAIVWRVAIGNRERLVGESASPAQRTPGDSLLPETTLDDQYAWDDSLDERIAEANEQLIYTAAEWRGYDAPYTAVDQRLQDLTESLGDEPL
jgi:hypothetical protein